MMPCHTRRRTGDSCAGRGQVAIFDGTSSQAVDNLGTIDVEQAGRKRHVDALALGVERDKEGFREGYEDFIALSGFHYKQGSGVFEATVAVRGGGKLTSVTVPTEMGWPGSTRSKTAQPMRSLM